MTTGKLETALSKSIELPHEVWRRLWSERDHELRAALICLLKPPHSLLRMVLTATTVGVASLGQTGI